MIRIFLNNIEATNQPIGLKDLTEQLELNKDIHGYLYQITGNLTFIGADYDYLRGLYDAGYCQDVDLIIQKSFDFGNTYTNIAKALIKLAGVKWDRIKRTAECPIVDNSFQSRIYNNRQIEFQLGDHSGTVLSKNGVDVSSKVVYHSNVYLFSPFRGRYFFSEANYFKSDPPFPASEGDDLVNLQPQARSGMFIYDALNLIIAMMTDDEVDFVSDYFSYDIADLTTANPEALAVLMTGGHLRNGSTYPKLKFEQFFNDLHKLYNVWFAMEYTSGGKPRMRVENEAYFRQQNSNVYFDSVKAMHESVNLEKIYSSVKVGCSVSSSGNFPVGQVPLVMHNQEQFPLSGTCNVSNELDLRLEKLIINTNAISEALPPIVGFSTGGSVKRKYTNEEVTSGSGGTNQMVIDTSATFKESLIQQKFLLTNTRTGEWTYITGVPDNDRILLMDLILTVDNTGLTKDYEIFKPSEDTIYRNEVFLIQISSTLGPDDVLLAAQSEIDPPADLYIYNPLFANYEVITRHMGGVAQSIVSSLSDGNDEFEAGNSTGFNIANTTYLLATTNSQYKRIRFNDETTSPYFDTNNNYNPVTGIYTAPQSGYYHAYCSLQITNSALSGEDYTQQVELLSVSASGDVLDSESTFTTITNLATYTFSLDRVFYLQEGDTLQVWIKKRFGLSGLHLNQYVDWSDDATGYGPNSANDLVFGVDFLYNGGGVVPASTPNDVRLIDVESELSISRETFDSIIANPYKYYHTNMNPEGENPLYVTGFISKISRGIEDGECTLTQFKKQNGV